MKIDGHAIRELSATLDRPIKTLVVNDDTDPFYLPERRMRYAEWFAALYREHGFSRGVHLRRIHYILVSQQEPVRLPDGGDYVNTVACAKLLNYGASAARFAGLVDAEDFEDRRNPAPMLFLPPPVDEPSVDVSGETEFSITPPGLEVSIWPGSMPDQIQEWGLLVSAECPAPHVEIWCEKSTVNDVLEPLARDYGLNLQTSVGEMSITICRELVERAGSRPVRIIYVSDFDPAGQSMPVAASWKIEWFACKREDETGAALDIQLNPIVLTHDQCIEYELPRTPIKEGEMRAARFEERFGEGATELDALEALHPGELERILVAEIEKFHSPDFEAEWDSVREDAQGTVDEIADEILERHADARGALEQRRAALEAARIEQVSELRRLADERMADLRRLANERFAGLARQGEQLAADVNAHNAEIGQDLYAEAPHPGEFDWPAPPEGWDDPLLDSTREYVEQIDRYKNHQGKRIDRKPRVVTKQHSLVCTICGAAFKAKRENAKFCSRACNATDCRKRYRAKNPRGPQRARPRAPLLKCEAAE